MSDERSVEARILSLLTLSLSSNFVDPIVNSSNAVVVIPTYVTDGLRDTTEFSPRLELRRLARLGLVISDRTQTDNSCFNSLAMEICTSVYDAISRPFPMPHLHSLTRLLQDVEAFSSRNSPYHTEQVQEYRRRLGYIIDDGSEELTASSTSLQVRDVDSSARRTRYPPAIGAPASHPDLFLESVEPNGRDTSGISMSQIYLCFLFVYHLILLRLPTTFNSLALDAFFSQDGNACELDLWDGFTEILLKQWKTLGLFSTLVFGATLTMFQIPSITDNSLLRIIVHSALLCVMMSLIYTSLLSVYFGGWQSTDTAARWMQEMRTANPHTFWNFWVLISLPAVWTCWGIFLFLASMILFAWPLGQYDSSQDVPEASLGTRVFLMLVVVAGVVHLALAISKLRRVSNPVSAVGVENSV
ncbi:hypothetical protein B0H19DRAFT_471049 [Mycena capillaripes]|nr:hypothetical protein B0H19DRAFT_471049 [Mycena capillaripes]